MDFQFQNREGDKRMRQQIFYIQSSDDEDDASYDDDGSYDNNRFWLDDLIRYLHEVVSQNWK